MKSYSSSVLMICALGLTASKSVRVTELSVPSTAIFGESVTLSCSYDLGTEELYVVKWYKDDLEFYRFEPKDKNQSVYFPQAGIDIDLSKSGRNVVVLKSVALDTAGTYKCQVSTDAPTYSCVQAVKEMSVVGAITAVMPLEGPTISGGEKSYDFGDNITLNCTSAKSKPAAIINWLMNDQPVEGAEVVDHGVTTDTEDLEATTKTLKLAVTKDLFKKGRVDIKCVASFYDKVAMISKDITILELNAACRISPGYIPFLISLLITLWPAFR